MRQRFFVSTIESEKKEAAPPARTMESHRPAIYLWSLHQINQRLINAFLQQGHRHDNTGTSDVHSSSDMVHE